MCTHALTLLPSNPGLSYVNTRYRHIFTLRLPQRQHTTGQTRRHVYEPATNVLVCGLPWDSVSLLSSDDGSHLCVCVCVCVPALENAVPGQSR